MFHIEKKEKSKFFNIRLYYITDSVKGIEEAETRILGSAKKYITFLEEDKSKIKAAIFYSIVSTQKGLQVVDLCNENVNYTFQVQVDIYYTTTLCCKKYV